ncbi:MAG: response regulator [Thermodesulfobacteriota bacterium]
MSLEQEKPRILIVDDVPENVHVLARALRDRYHLSAATGGQEALALAAGDNRPDLILLDIIMPDMDGYEVCRRLKAAEAIRDIPVIFVTGLGDGEDESYGLELGAVDYITKPINLSVLRARVSTQLALQAQRRELAQANWQLRQEMEERRRLEQQLAVQREREARQAAMIHSGRLAALGEMAASMAHEIGQPLSVMSLTVQTWALLHQRGRLTLEQVMAELPKLIGSLKRVDGLIEHVRTFGRKAGEPADVSLTAVALDAVGLCRHQFKTHGIVLAEHLPEEVPPVRAVAAELEQVVLNLLSNARHAVEDRRDREGTSPWVEIRVEPAADRVSLFVADNGGGVPEDKAELIFDPFFTTKPSSQGTGLGLAISMQVMEKFGGLVLHNRPGEGATFELWVRRTGNAPEAAG